MTSILIGYDRTPRCARAIGAAARLFEGAHAIVLNVGVVPEPAVILPGAAPVAAATPAATRPDLEESARRSARDVAAVGAREAERIGLRATPIAALATSSAGIADAIIRTAQESAPDVIVVASGGRSALKAAFLGSVSQAVLRRADRPVLIVPDPN